MSRAWIAIVLILGCSCIVPAFAKQNGCQHKTIPVSISTKDGAPAPQLNSTNLEGTYRKRPIRVTSVVINQDPPRVVILLDVSGSMHGMRSESDMNFSLDLAEDLVAYMPAASEIGLGFFSTELDPISRPTMDRKTLKYQLEALRAHPTSFKGRKTLWTAILDSVKLFDRPHLGDTIYVITDGGDNASNVSMNHVAQILGELGVRLFAFVFQHTEGIPPEEESGPRNVLQVVDATGGRLVAQNAERLGVFPVVHNPALLDKAGKATKLGSLLGWQYFQMYRFNQVDLDLPETVDKPRELKLDLVGFSKPQRDNLILTYPHMLVPCH